MKRTTAFIFLFAWYPKINAQTAALPESKHKFIVIAHRGDHVEVPENTIAAYENATVFRLPHLLKFYFSDTVFSPFFYQIFFVMYLSDMR